MPIFIIVALAFLFAYFIHTHEFTEGGIVHWLKHDSLRKLTREYPVVVLITLRHDVWRVLYNRFEDYRQAHVHRYMDDLAPWYSILSFLYDSDTEFDTNFYTLLDETGERIGQFCIGLKNIEQANQLLPLLKDVAESTEILEDARLKELFHDVVFV
jgi:hypothetical protein